MDPHDITQIGKVEVDARCEEIDEPWSPVDLATVNDQVVRMALFHGEYHWHRHEGEDELFYVYRGEVTIRIRGQADVVLGAGEMAVIPRNVEHRPESFGPSKNLKYQTIQRKTQVHTSHGKRR